MNTLPLIFLCVMINTAAQLLLKQGVNRLGSIEFTWNHLFSFIPQFVLNPFIFAGMVCFVLSMFAWLFVLSRVQVSFAYPMLSIGYIATAFAAYLLLNEPLSFTRLLGIFVIIAGVFLITRSA